MAKIVLPKLSQTGANLWSSVQANDEAIQAVVNSELSNENLSGAAGITDANIASPNNVAYRTIYQGIGTVTTGKTAGTYLFIPPASGASITPAGSFEVGSGTGLYFFHFAAADYAVASKTQKLRLRSQIGIGGTAATITYTLGLYPLTISAGKWAGGSVTSGSTVALVNPTLNTVSQGNSGDFTIPADGAYAVCVVLSGTANVFADLSFQLQTRSV